MILNLFLVSGVFLWTRLSSCGLLHGAWARLTADWPRDCSTLCDLSLLVSSSVWPRGSSPVSTMGRLMCPAQSINSPSLFPPWETQLSVLMRVCVWGEGVHAQSCLTLCNPMDCYPPGSSAHGIFQARILEWVAMPSSRGTSWLRDWTCTSYISCMGISCISCVGRQILYHSATWEAKLKPLYPSTIHIRSFFILFLDQVAHHLS